MGKAVGGGIYGMEEGISATTTKTMDNLHIEGHMNPLKWNKFTQDLNAWLKANWPTVTIDVKKIKPPK